MDDIFVKLNKTAKKITKLKTKKKFWIKKLTHIFQDDGTNNQTMCAFYDTSVAKWGADLCSRRRGFVCKKMPIKPEDITVCHQPEELEIFEQHSLLDVEEQPQNATTDAISDYSTYDYDY